MMQTTGAPGPVVYRAFTGHERGERRRSAGAPLCEGRPLNRSFGAPTERVVCANARWTPIYFSLCAARARRQEASPAQLADGVLRGWKRHLCVCR